MPSSTVEDYIKTLYLLEQESDKPRIAMGKLAEAMQVVPGTATTMVRTLREAGLVHYASREGVQLSSGGQKLALHVLRRHRLIEKLLVDIIGLDWSEVHEEAEQLEHVISDRLLDRIDELLNYPSVDPHGDPIPTSEGTLTSTEHPPLTSCDAKDTITIRQIIDQDAAFLQMLDAKGLTPGSTVTVETIEPAAETLTLKTDGHSACSLGWNAASKILVEK